MQVFELAAVFEVISRLQFDVLVQCLLNIGDNLLDVCVTHIDPDDDAPFGCIPVDLQWPTDKVDACYLSNRDLNSFRSAYKQLIKIQVGHFLLVKPDHEIESPFVFKDYTC